VKPVIYKVPLILNSSISVREVRLPYFDATWHFHQEYELVLITQSSGKRFIGSHIADFEPGDLAFLGPGLPHLYRNSEEYYQPGVSTPEAVSIVIQFPETFLGNPFLEVPEMFPIRQLFSSSDVGLSIYGHTREVVTRKMHEMLMLQGMERLLHLLSILNMLAHSEEYQPLSIPGIVGSTAKDTERINTIYKFVLARYQQPIILKEVASLVSMSPSAFCRYFKMRTKKTFWHFLNEIRIGHSCKLLLEEDMNITQVSLASGFNNISNFNRQFRLITDTTPMNYRKEYLKKSSF
jgi:AraC-like DNA-binding protein